MNPTRRDLPPRLPDHGRNGELGAPVRFDLPEYEPPERRWLALGCGLCTLSAFLVGLGVWKATELVTDAL